MLQAWGSGDASVLVRLTPIVYAELHRIARRKLAAERDGHQMQPTALVNEAFVRLLGDAPVAWVNRAHFFGISAHLMRQILIDFARAQNTEKRGNGALHVTLSAAAGIVASHSDLVDLIDLDQALDELAQLDQRQAKLVELRYFGGLENREIAAVLGISEPTVARAWRLARAWLFDRLQSPKRPALDATLL
jgi:RNA polymerase sigma factor (TIGR02999 family)